MESFMTFGETVLVVLGGLLIRALIAVAGFALVVIPILAVFMAVRGGKTLHQRLHGFARAGSLLLKNGLYYAPGHTWLQEQGNDGIRIGVDDLAQRILADARTIRVAPAGQVLRRGDTLAEVGVGARTARIPAPADGTVVRVNDDLASAPDLVHRDPYRKGWIALLRPSSSEFRQFPTGAGARTWLEEEDRRLSRFFDVQLGVAAADGGDFVLPPPALLDDAQWRELTRSFLADAPVSH